MTANKTNPIVSITLEGFQIFDKPTYIPLDRLTLLFGPNSAGKSAVQDALELYTELLKCEVHKSNSTLPFLPTFPRIKSTLEEIELLLNRHWRRQGDNGNHRSERFSICVSQIHFSNDPIEISVPKRLGRFLSENVINASKEHLIESRWFFDGSDFVGEEVFSLFDFDFEFLIDSKTLISYKDANFSVYLDHHVFHNFQSEFNFHEVAEKYSKHVSYTDGCFTILEGVAGLNPSGQLDRWGRWLYWNLNRKVSLDGKVNAPEVYENSGILDAIDEISFMLHGFLLVTLGDFSKFSFKQNKVDASREIPKRSDLIFKIGCFNDFIDDMNFWDIKKNDSIYSGLMYSLTSELTRFLYDGLKKDYSENVNRILSDHLFLDQGYRIDFDYRVILSKEASEAAVQGVKLQPYDFGYIFEIFLRDGKGRKHLFEDVGSGIGYLLPVLCTILRPLGGIGPSVFSVQQPELHIHPALQAAMGDVFIEASAEDRQILIETHSEHLLLRILKRIRQTHLQAAIAPELKINADDVCVLYFDPSPDGTTSVKRLRITEDGEFMDRWPRGFFAERDQELLDE
jgi:hypothetical protein